MSGSNIQLIQWIISALFCISVLISICGIVFIISPGVLTRYSDKLNRWISTSNFFNLLDRPRHIERFFYRYHYVFGILIIFGAGYSLYEFFFSLELEKAIRILPVLGNVEFSRWLYQFLYYFMMFANVLAVIVGIIILIRPSLLKGIERMANQWITSEEYTKPLDQTHSIPEHILPGNVRVFGVLVFLGGIYIMITTGMLLLK